MPSSAELVLRLFLQLAVILAVCRAAGLTLTRFGQTQVVGEMVAGFLLGPSLLGALAPAIQDGLFPKTLRLSVGAAERTIQHPSMTILYALSQIGLILFMFLVGVNVNTRLLTTHFRQAGQISVVGILAPALAGGLLGAGWAGDGRFFPDRIDPWQAGLFLAAAMAVTAFPVLARILHDTGAGRTRVGTLALGAAAFDDAVAWSLLAVVLGTAEGSSGRAILAIGGGGAYVLVVLLARPLLRRFELRGGAPGLTPARLAAALLVLALAAAATEAIGIHAVFGAFVLGAAMPRGGFAEELRRALEPITVAVLVPIFFVYAGLNTEIGLLDEPALVGAALLTVAVALISKGGGCAVAMRLGGADWRESGAVGALMNARGLMELVLIGIALEEGLITPTLYTILALMAIVTTLLAAPIFRRLYALAPSAREALTAAPPAGSPAAEPADRPAT